jgi:hypothetical protein
VQLSVKLTTGFADPRGMKRGVGIHSSPHRTLSGLMKTGRSPIKALTTFPQSRSWVPHISLVFGEMWDSTALSPKIFPA